jgi:hypothetical protein
VTTQNVTDARLISCTGTLEPPQHVGIKPQRNQLFRVVRFRTPTTNQSAAPAVIRGRKPLFRQFGNLIIFVRSHDMTVNLSQIASQNALFRGQFAFLIEITSRAPPRGVQTMITIRPRR